MGGGDHPGPLIKSKHSLMGGQPLSTGGAGQPSGPYNLAPGNKELRPSGPSPGGRAKNWPLEGNRADSRKFLVENPIQIFGSQRGGYRVRGGYPPPVPPSFKIQMFVQDFPQDISENPPGCLPVASLFFPRVSNTW